MIHYMHIIRHLQGCSSEPDTSVLQCHLGKHIILPLSLGLPPRLGMAMFPTRCRTIARIPWYSIMQIEETSSTGVICHLAEAKLDQICLCKNRAIRCHKADMNFVPNHICIHQPSCRRCHAAFTPKLPKLPCWPVFLWRFIAPKA